MKYKEYNFTDKLYRFKELSPELQIVLIKYINTIASGSSLFNETKLRNHIEKDNDILNEEFRKTLNKGE